MAKPKSSPVSTSSVFDRARQSMNLSKRAADGVWVSLVGPDGNDYGIAVLVVSATLKKARRKRDELAVKVSRKSPAWRKKNQASILADYVADHLVIDWWTWDADEDETPDFENDQKPEGHEPYDAKQLAAFLKHEPEYGENTSTSQIDIAASDASNYSPVPDMGKPASTSADV